MSTDTEDKDREHETVGFTPSTAVHRTTPTDALVSATVGDRCVNCGATLSSDQRYCVICGERRGAPRFTLPAATVTTTETTVARAARGPRPARFGSGTTLVAGVGTLLLALLVGFVIGNAASRNNTKTVSAAAPAIRVVNVGGGSTGASASGSAATGTSGAATHHASSSAKPKSKAAVHRTIVTKKVVSAESNAASKVLGGHNTPPASTKVGQTCSGSACNKAGFNKKTHKFDGSFFGQ